MPTLLLVEDNPAHARALSEQLQHPQINLVGVATGLQDALRLLRQKPDIAAIDLHLTDDDGIDLVRELATQKATIPVVLSAMRDRRRVLEAISAGATGYVLKSDPHIAEAMLAVYRGETPLSPAIAGYLLQQLRQRSELPGVGVPPLTPREREVLERLAVGDSDRDIAASLSISPHTVSDHSKAIYRKLQVRSRSGAVHVARQVGLLGDF